MRRLLPCGALLLAAGPASAQEEAADRGTRRVAEPLLEPQLVTFVQADRLEGRASEAERVYLVDLQGWMGHRCPQVLGEIEGEGVVGGELEELEVQAPVQPDDRLVLRSAARRASGRLGGRAANACGGRHPGAGAPYWLEIDAAAFVSLKGDATAKVEAEYELLFT